MKKQMKRKRKIVHVSRLNGYAGLVKKVNG